VIDALSSKSLSTELCPSINVSFPLRGKQLPADHGYLLYAAISKSSSSLHGIDWLAIELISGFPSGRGLIALSERDATLRLRIPADHYRDVLPLAGKRLDIGGHQIRLGLPVARPLDPAPSLYARVVTIKKFTEAEPFLEAVKRKLDSFGVKGRVELPSGSRGRACQSTMAICCTADFPKWHPIYMRPTGWAYIRSAEFRLLPEGST